MGCHREYNNIWLQFSAKYTDKYPYCCRMPYRDLQCGRLRCHLSWLPVATRFNTKFLSSTVNSTVFTKSSLDSYMKGIYVCIDGFCCAIVTSCYLFVPFEALTDNLMNPGWKATMQNPLDSFTAHDTASWWAHWRDKYSQSRFGYGTNKVSHVTPVITTLKLALTQTKSAIPLLEDE